MEFKLDDSFEEIMVYAFRYCLGRRSYAPHNYVKYAEKYIKFFSDNIIELMIREIDFNRNALGDEVDKKVWISFYYKLLREINNRGKNEK